MKQWFCIFTLSVIPVWTVLYAQERESPLLKNALGICGHTVQFEAGKFAPAFSQVRDYHPVRWDLDGDTSVLPKWPFAKNKVNWEDVYTSWRKEGFRTIASLVFSGLPYEKWKDLERDAFAYGKSFADEFGSEGLEVLDAVEIGNEPGHYTDDQYEKLFVSMASGIRSGDPKLKIATCASRAGSSGRYFKSLGLFEKHLGLLDVITLHVYAQTEGWPTWKRTYPEDRASGFLRWVKEVVAWRDRHAPGCPVWVTEYGWDCTTRMEAREGAFKQWEGNVSDEAQAAYLLRATVLLLHAGVERTYIYFFNDQDEPRVHGASGVMRKGVPKPSFYALTQMRSELGEFRLTCLEKRPGEVYVSFWKNESGGKKALIWRGKGIGQKVTRTHLPWTGKPVLKKMVLTGGESAALVSPEMSPEGWIIEVGPRPVYVE